MNYISATDLKNKMSDVINEVRFKGVVTIVEKHGKPVAKIVPINADDSESDFRESNIEKDLKRTFGSLPNFPDVTSFRRSRKKASLKW